MLQYVKFVYSISFSDLMLPISTAELGTLTLK